jgi:pyruvate formate lyase activating enzyme
VQDGPGIRTTVFLKGCPLTCLWCSNPESQKKTPEILYRENLCSQCYRCIDVCPNKAIVVRDDGFVATDRRHCTGCGACESACLNEARKLTGKYMTVDEVMAIVIKDMDYYRNSGGGVTTSGGEACGQPAFLTALLERCQKRGLHTTLDTCGFVASETLESILGHVDLVLYDIKAVDPELHKRLTGVSNEIILKNARLIADKGIEMIFRVPLIPENNATLENVEAIVKFAHELGDLEVNLLPYHRLGVGKYKSLDMEYPLENLKTLETEYIESLYEKVRAHYAQIKVVY